MNRRKFINNITRGGLLAGLATMSSVFLIRNKKNQNTQCSYEFVCRNCKKIDNCILPEAALYKYEQTAKQKK
ncbi:MAG: hypothetical protein HN600_05715 [Bacteroidetes bacterium]|nr:hypothetical protein [Bacteroidota bacterium]